MRPKPKQDLTYILTDTQTRLNTVLLRNYEELIEVEVEIDMPTGELVIRDFHEQSIKRVFAFSVGDDRETAVPLNSWDRHFKWSVDFNEILETYSDINYDILHIVGTILIVDMKLSKLYNELQYFSIDWSRYNPNFIPYTEPAYPVSHLRSCLKRLQEFGDIGKDQLLDTVDLVVNSFSDQIEVVDVYRIDNDDQVDVDVKYEMYREIEKWLVSDHTGKYLVVAAKNKHRVS